MAKIIRQKFVTVIVALAMVFCLLPILTMPAGAVTYDGTSFSGSGTSELTDSHFVVTGRDESGSTILLSDAYGIALGDDDGYSEVESGVINFASADSGAVFTMSSITVSVCRKYTFEITYGSSDTVVATVEVNPADENTFDTETGGWYYKKIALEPRMTDVVHVSILSKDPTETELMVGQHTSIVGFTAEGYPGTPTTVTTGSVTDAASTSATMGGSVTAGSAEVTDRGVVYSTTDETPTIGESGVTKDANGTGAGSFSKLITGLTPSETYYVCAYATSSVGTSYGSVVNFTTGAVNTAPTFVDSGDGSLTVAMNAGATDITSPLHVSDTDSSQTLTWSEGSAPSHGTLSFSSATASSGNTDITPGGTITYTPAADYSGDDSFAVKISDGISAATRTINVTVDGTAPTVSSVSVPSNGTYKMGDTLNFTVNFNEAVTVTTDGGTPYISLTFNTGGTVHAPYVSGSGSSALVFSYTVTSGDLDADGITVSSLIKANGGTLRDAVGNDADLQLNSVGSTTSVKIDAIAPMVSSVSVPTDGTYKTGGTLSFMVNFSEYVTVAGAPYIPVTLDTGGIVNASYASGSGTTALTFSYTVASGNLDADGIGVGSAITANGGTLRDAAGNDAALALNSVGSTAGVLVDAVAPTVSSIERSIPAFAATNTSAVTFRVTFSEAVSGVDTTDFSLDKTGRASGTIASVSAASGTTIDVTVNSVSGEGVIRLDLNSSETGITDGAGNAISGGYTSGQTYTIDTAPPTTSVTTQTVAPGANIMVQSTETGTVYLISNTLDSTAYDAVSKLDALVSVGSATKVTISMANTDKAITAPSLSGAYAAVAVDPAGNMSAKTANLITVDADAPTAGVTTQTVAPGANITVQSTETGTVYLIGSTLLAADYDTVTKLDTLVGSTATKVTISTANTNTTILAPSTAGTYAAVAVDAVGNISLKTESFVTVDTTAPTVSSIIRNSPTGTTTNAESVIFRVTFSETVTGVDATDFTAVTVTGTATGTVSEVSAVSGSEDKQYDVTVNTITGTGTLRLDLNSSGTGIADSVGNAISGGYTSGQTYTVDTAAPTVTLSAQTVKGGANVTVQSTETGTVYLIGSTLPADDYDTVTELDALVGSTATKVTISTANTNTTILAPSTAGTYAAVAVDVAGNISAMTGSLVTVDTAAPTASVTEQTVAAGANVTVQSTETGTVYLIGSTLLAADYDTVTKLDTLVGSTATKVTISTANTNTTILAPSTAGTYAAVAVDAAGNISLKTESFVTVDTTPPTILSASRTDNTHIVVTLSEACQNLALLSSGGFTVTETAGALTYTVSETAQGTNSSQVVLTVADMSVSGKEGVTVSFTKGADTITDTVGNTMETDNTGVAVTAWDSSAPAISSATVSSDYKYIDITFSEGVYGATDGATALTAAKLALTFTQNSGTAANAVISSIKKADNTAEASASALIGGETTIRVFLTVTGTPSGAETIEIKPANSASIFDHAGNNMALTETTGAKKLYIPASSGGSSSGSITNNGATVIVNGETKTAGTAQTTTNSSGQTTTTVTVDTGKLQTILDSQGSGATVTIPITGNPNVAEGTLTGAMVKSMENKDATLVVQTASGTYTLPASEININAVSQKLGTSVALSDIKVTVSISEPSASMTKVIESAAQDGGFTIMVPAVDYTITCTHGSQTVDVSSFNAYVERTIAIPDGVDPTKITTGVVVDPDGTTHHVPTRVTLIGSKYYAVINSLTNSTYSVVWNPIEFSDVTNHWAKVAINDMGSRMVVTGVGNNNYAPDRNMTRAEFATIMVRALGLEPGTGASGFGDVASTDWCSGYIKTAASYGIVGGYDNGNFGPNDMITREQAMTMIARAMKITGLTVTLTDSDVSTLIEAYTDGASASAYAKDSMAACLKTGITSGTSAITISPKANITRAEVAVMVERLLQKSNLI